MFIANETTRTIMSNLERSPLIEAAAAQYSEFDMDDLPPELQRNSSYYYYLSVYPGLGQMNDLHEAELPKLPSEVKSAYVHTPYCTGVCSFCSYFLTTVNDQDRSPITSYYETVKQEISQRATETDLNLSYIYFGGGTPSLIPLKTLEDFFSFLKSNQFLDENLYGTLELHPEFFNDPNRAQEFIDILKFNGVKRVSLGYQSSEDDILETTNRRHSSLFLREAIQFLKENEMMVGLDLMYGLPGMTHEQWEQTLNEAISCDPDSIATYFLFLSPRTAMHAQVKRGVVQLPPHRQLQTQHIMAQLLLSEHGYHELPNDFYAKVQTDPLAFNQESLPSSGVSLPIGAGSYGHYDSTQFFNQFSLKNYKEAIDAHRSPIWRGYKLVGEEAMRRDVMFSLKNSPYMDLKLFESQYGLDPLVVFEGVIHRLLSLQMVAIDDTRHRLTLTPKGRLCVEEIACLFAIPNFPLRKSPHSSHERRKIEKHHFAPLYNLVRKA